MKLGASIEESSTVEYNSIAFLGARTGALGFCDDLYPGCHGVV